MTEQVAYQASMFGGEEIAGDVVDKCRAMLAEEPATREDYEYAWLRYLVRYHGLSGPVLLDLMAVLGRGAPGFRTVALRCQEIMKGDASLQPPREVMQRRQEQRRQGRVR